PRFCAGDIYLPRLRLQNCRHAAARFAPSEVNLLYKSGGECGEPLFFKRGKAVILVGLHQPDGKEKFKSFNTIGSGLTRIIKKLKDKNIILAEDFNLRKIIR
ncbi:MAG: hypothetical protein LBG16_05305, partial [Elusimicrobiota bacterium]|nr:hypothetical protein [Elusimicrobiota bacterium]